MLKQIITTLLLLSLFTLNAYSQNKCDSTSFFKAIEFSQSGDIDSAIIKYSEQIKECPNFSEAYINRAVCYYNKKQKDLFYKDLNIAIEVTNDKVHTSILIAGFFFAAKRYDTAFVMYNNILKIDPDNAEAYFKMGRCRWLARIKILQANNVEDYATDTVFISYLKDEILKYYGKAISLDSAINDTRYSSRNPMEALQDVNSNYEYYYDRGLFKMNFGDYSGSLKDYEKSIQIHPTIDAYQYAAYLAKKVGQNQKACDYIQTWATLMNPSERISLSKKHEIADKFCNDIGIKK